MIKLFSVQEQPKCVGTYKVKYATTKKKTIIHQVAVVASHFCGFPFEILHLYCRSLQGTCCWKSVLSGCCASAGWGELLWNQKVVVSRFEASSIYMLVKNFPARYWVPKEMLLFEHFILSVCSNQTSCVVLTLNETTFILCIQDSVVCVVFFSAGRTL